MFAFTWYNSKHMDMTAGNPQMKMMKYMQFAFPILFFFAFLENDEQAFCTFIKPLTATLNMSCLFACNVFKTHILSYSKMSARTFNEFHGNSNV